ncbi:3-phosphoshikimate 1-carboxyvinyltransferase [Lapidilactobacillus mulanensis]|uniref:3-phosphoshikimate 1-carboxyvinyltransferase n=1 Tax=Lapidilactobacillus mulanensis TaxID=2485999 RepID=A0ABW4DQU9_9LACO|nr:3-phosphoshikimate 1-carboxyvinyltransferase [Lapidilactobacillus mulanensis]
MTDPTLQNRYEHDLQLHTGQFLQGDYQTPSDKSISHRALIFGAIASGPTVIENILDSQDVQTTQLALQQLGVNITTAGKTTTVQGQAGCKFAKPQSALDFGNSGTTARLFLGLLARQSFSIQIQGDASLSQRPMARVVLPLTTMGMQSRYLAKSGYLPLSILPSSTIHGIHYQMPMASAQLKSALILAALQADSPTEIEQPAVSRDHTERMLRQFGGGDSLQVHGLKLLVSPLQHPLQAQHVVVPGDPSSAAFLITAALLLPQSRLVVKNQSLNETRTGFLQIIHQLAPTAVTIGSQSAQNQGEPAGDICIHSVTNRLAAFRIDAHNLGSLIDEIPILSLLATQCAGTTVIRDATELRYKETDRLSVIATELTQLGANITEQPDGLQIIGPTKLHASVTTADSHKDHRIAMMLVIAAVIIGDRFPIKGLNSIAISNPTFMDDLISLLKD